MGFKKSKLKKKEVPRKSQFLYTPVSEYKGLSDEDKTWLDQFNRGTAQNNHRDFAIFTNHPKYKTKIKKELDAATNCRNRNVYLGEQNLTLSMFEKVEGEDSIIDANKKLYLNDEPKSIQYNLKYTENLDDVLRDLVQDFAKRHIVDEGSVLRLLFRYAKIMNTIRKNTTLEKLLNKGSDNGKTKNKKKSK